jgi:hypothetical protein
MEAAITSLLNNTLPAYRVDDPRPGQNATLWLFVVEIRQEGQSFGEE